MATQEELKRLQNKICDVMAIKTPTMEDWRTLWKEAEKCRKTCDPKIWASFYWNSGLETVAMILGDEI